MKNSKYSVLLMRDDKGVKRFRVSPVWLKIVIYLELVLVACAGLGGWAGYSYWHRVGELKAKGLVLENSLSEAKIDLERCRNQQKISDSLRNGTYPVIAPPPTQGAASKPEPVEHPPVDLNQLFTRVDVMMAGIENLKARLSGSTMSVSFDLNNMRPQGDMLSGEVAVKLMLSDGSLVDVDASNNDLTFQIQRFKRIRASFSLPNGVNQRNLFGVRLTIADPEGKVIFSETYPLSNILA